MKKNYSESEICEKIFLKELLHVLVDKISSRLDNVWSFNLSFEKTCKNYDQPVICSINITLHQLAASIEKSGEK